MDSEELTLLFADKVGDWRVGDWTGPRKASTMRKKRSDQERTGIKRTKAEEEIKTNLAIGLH